MNIKEAQAITHTVEARQDARLGVQHTGARMQDWHEAQGRCWQRLRELLRIRARQV